MSTPPKNYESSQLFYLRSARREVRKEEDGGDLHQVKLRGLDVFEPTSTWEKIHCAVKADFEDSVWEHLRGSVSAPFVAGEQVAVKVIDDRGNELMVVKKIQEVMK